MLYENIVRAFNSHIWALTPEKLEQLRAFLHNKVRDSALLAEEKEILAGSRKRDVQMYGRVAVVPVQGVLAQRMSMLEQSSGGASAESIGATLDELANDKTVKAIVMAIDSPGGSVFGIQELGNKIYGYRGTKKIVGVADSMAASGAYWLLAQCQETNVTLGGLVGSIGVYTAHVDYSGMEEAMGVKTTFVSAGKYKTDGMGPLTDEHRTHLQGQVESYYGAFVSAVAKGRGVSEAKVKSDFGEGRTVTAQAAVAAGMVDKVATLEQVLRRLGAEAGSSGSSALAAADAKLREMQMRERGLI